MKNLLIFLFGASVGAVGTLFYLRKGIKKQLETIENEAKNSGNSGGNGEKKEENSAENDAKESNIPFEMKEDGMPNALKETTKVQYNKIVEDNYRGRPPVPITENGSGDGAEGADGGCFEIDIDDFMHDDSNEKVRLVYYRGDRIMATENGTILTNPAMFVGTTWENCVGNYADHTAFIRNARLVTDYEIYVEDGLYTDEYGDESLLRED